MSEDDRAAKAARAKALLKKRQQKKAAGTPADSQSVSSPPVSRPFTPQLSDQPPSSEPSTSPPVGADTQFRDPASLFGDAPDGDDSWIRALSRVDPPAPQLPTDVTSPSHTSTSPRLSNGSGHLDDKFVKALEAERDTLRSEIERLTGVQLELQETGSRLQESESKLAKEQERSKALEAQLQRAQSEKDAAVGIQQSQQQTISLLVSEKASLTSDLELLSEVQQNARESAAQLAAEKTRGDALADRVRQLAAKVLEVSQQVAEYESKEKDLSERCRDQERELQLANGKIKQHEAESAQHQQRVRDLEEQIQSDDRAERLEESLQNTRDRADELELKLTKLKQSHQNLTSDRNELASQLDTARDVEAKSRSRIAELEEHQQTLQTQLHAVTAEKEAVQKESAELQSQVSSHQVATRSLQDKFDSATKELARLSHELGTTQTELRNAIRRAEDAERTQADLQTEGTNLMRSLDEMRPKIVELTGVKLELGEQIESLERTLKMRDSTINELESELDQLREENEEVTKKLQSALTLQEKDQSQSQAGLADLQKAYSDVQAELESAMASVRSLESERSSHHQEATHRLDVINDLKKTSKEQADKIVSLRRELDEQLAEQDENQDLLDRIQGELEALRDELTHKDEEIERLRQNSSPTKSNDPHSLDYEIVDSLRQQHALELSTAQSTIRALEDSVFEAQSRAHALQKQVVALEEQVAAQRSTSRNSGQRPFSPVNGVPSRPSSRGHGHRSTSSLSAPPITRSVFEQHLSPETLHKRKVSLSMLKARIESETAATSHPPSRTMSPIPDNMSEPHDDHDHHDHAHHQHSDSLPHNRSHFLDESHVFWCHSCSGDLVVL